MRKTRQPKTPQALYALRLKRLKRILAWQVPAYIGIGVFTLVLLPLTQSLSDLLFWWTLGIDAAMLTVYIIFLIRDYRCPHCHSHRSLPQEDVRKYYAGNSRKAPYRCPNCGGDIDFSAMLEAGEPDQWNIPL